MYRLNIYTDYLNWVCPETAYCTQIQWCVIIFPTKIIQNTLRLPQIWSDAFFFTLIHFQVLSCKCILYISIQYIHIYIYTHPFVIFCVCSTNLKPHESGNPRIDPSQRQSHHLPSPTCRTSRRVTSLRLRTKIGRTGNATVLVNDHLVL
jgi:hypothetical protein